MATIYRFIVEQKTSATTGGRNQTSGGSKGAAKKGRTITLNQMLTGQGKGGVEHNRKLRAINPLLNRATGGAWEKSMRLSRAGLGLVKFNSTTGAFAGLSGTAITIIIAFIIQSILKWQAKDRQRAERLNAQNFKQLQNGSGAIYGQYKINTNYWSGRRSYNQNK